VISFGQNCAETEPETRSSNKIIEHRSDDNLRMYFFKVLFEKGYTRLFIFIKIYFSDGLFTVFRVLFPSYTKAATKE
jgi:hypothetical protein